MIGRALLHYRIEKKLGEGGQGVLYRALDTKLGRTVVLKVLPPPPASAVPAAADRKVLKPPPVVDRIRRWKFPEFMLLSLDELHQAFGDFPRPGLTH